jgi:hypothetical protein
MEMAEANLKAAQASGDQRRIDLATENFEDAKRQYTQADPRRAYRAAVDERTQAQSETAAADKAATDARAAASKASRAAEADPQNAQLQEQAKQARVEAEKARLANLEAEQRRIRAGEEERAAAERLRDHLAKEAKLKEKIDSGIQKDFDAPGNERKGGMRVVADSDEMRVQQKEFKRTQQEWYPTTDSPDVPPGKEIGDGVLGINDRNTNRSMGLPDEGALTHERLHGNTSQNWKNDLGANKTLNEGMTHSLTIEKGEMAGAGGGRADADWAPGIPKAYPAEVQVVRKLESIVGKDVMRDAYFKGNTDNLMTEVGKRAGAPPGRELEVGREYLTKIDTLTRLAQDAKLAPAQQATAERHLATLLKQLGGKP